MADIQVQLRRGTTSAHTTFAGAEGEVTVDTDLDTLMVHTGGGAGTGIRLAKHSELSAGGGGTVVSIASGTGLTGGPITTSGTLSLASIANLRALGNVSGSNAAPVAVEIKDEDAMTSNSATALATQQSIKAYVDAQVGGVGGGGYASSWTSVSANNTSYTFNHNLGTKELIINAYYATSSLGVAQEHVNIYRRDYGCYITFTSDNAISVTVGSSGFGSWSSGAFSIVTWASKFLKVVITPV